MAPQYLLSLSDEAKKEFLNSFDTVICDCDGVLWKLEGVVEGAPEVINELIKCGKRVYFITNNSTRTREQFHAKVKKFGFNVPPENLYITSALAAQYLQKNLPPNKVAYVVGSPAIASELDAHNVNNFGVGKDESLDDMIENFDSLKIDMKEDVGAVVVGFDQYINYPKIVKAVNYLRNKECLFVCTNTDEISPTRTEMVLAATGSLVAAIRVASGRDPFVVGKPSTYMAEILEAKNEINPKRTLFIGDNCVTDIQMGNLCSFSTLLVLTGIHTIEYEAGKRASDSRRPFFNIITYFNTNTFLIYTLCKYCKKLMIF